MSKKNVRRFKEGEHLMYDQVFNKAKRESAIFAPERTSISHSYIADWIRDKGGIEKLISERKDKLSHAQGKLDDIDLKFSDLKKRAINTGRREPKKMPADLFEERLKAEARFDVVAEEIAYLEKTLSEFVEVEQKQDDSAVLKYGPVGMSKVKNNQVCEIDGQAVGKHESGLFMIDDGRSPYHGMLICDYLEHVVKPWIRLQWKHSSSVKKYRQHKAIAAEAGQPFSEKHPVPPKWPKPVMP